MRKAVGRIPDEILTTILEMARFECAVAPEVLSRVCHRWHVTANSRLGALLWSDIHLVVERETDIASLARKIRRYVERSRTCAISFIFTACSEITDKEVGVLWEAVKTGMPRCKELDVYPFRAFQHWFPLPGQLPLEATSALGASL